MAFKYKAFISYSHSDKKWGDWLHKALETYRVPRAVIGQPSRDGKVPQKLFPIFRDREELPTSDDLGGMLKNALEQSAYLVVICSPNAAGSLWVNEEILAFKRMGKENRILALLVDGEPNAADQGREDIECFPKALKFQIGEDGELTNQRTEPIAADARPGKDGKENAKLKLLAGLLGVKFDDLRQREKRRKRQQKIGLAAAATAILGTIGAVWFQGFQAQNKEEDARLYEESNGLAARAYGLLEDGRVGDAIRMALSGLPDNPYGGERPYNSSAFFALSLAMQQMHLDGLLMGEGVDEENMVFNDAGDRLLVFGETQGLALYDLETRQILWRVTELPAKSAWFAVEDTEIIVVTSDNGMVAHRLDPATGYERDRFKPSDELNYDTDQYPWGDGLQVAVRNFAALPDGEYVMYLDIYRIDTGQKIFHIPFDDTIPAYEVLPDYGLVIAFSGNRVKIYDGASDSVTVRLDPDDPDSLADAYAIDTVNGRLAINFRNDALLVFDLETGEVTNSLTTEYGSTVDAYHLKYTPDGRYLLATGGSGESVWDMEQQRYLPRLNTLAEDMVTMGTVEAPVYLAGGYDNNDQEYEAQLWMPDQEISGNHVMNFPGRAIYNPAREEWVVAGLPPQIWKNPGRPEISLEMPSYELEFSPDQKFLMSRNWDGRIEIIEVASGEMIIGQAVERIDQYIYTHWYQGSKYMALLRGQVKGFSFEEPAEEPAKDELSIWDTEGRIISNFKPISYIDVNFKNISYLKAQDLFLYSEGGDLLAMTPLGESAGRVTIIDDQQLRNSTRWIFRADAGSDAIIVVDDKGNVSLIAKDNFEILRQFAIGEDIFSVEDILLLDNDIAVLAYNNDLIFFHTVSGSEINQLSLEFGSYEFFWQEGLGLVVDNAYGNGFLLTSPDNWQTISQEPVTADEILDLQPGGGGMLMRISYGRLEQYTADGGRSIHCGEGWSLDKGRYSPDGAMILAWSYEGVCLMDADSLGLIQRWSGEASRIVSAIFSQDGRNVQIFYENGPYHILWGSDERVYQKSEINRLIWPLKLDPGPVIAEAVRKLELFELTRTNTRELRYDGGE